MSETRAAEAGASNSAPGSSSGSVSLLPSVSPASLLPPEPGLSDMAKLLFITAKLFGRNLISKEERKILKQLIIRNDPALQKIDLSSDDFLSRLVDLASSIAITAAASTFHNFLFHDCTTNQAKAMSKAERRDKGINSNDFVYGEIDFHSFAQIVSEVRPLFNPNGTFVDLGSGTGRACFAMALLSDCRRIVGVEALSQLVAASRAVLHKYEAFIESDEVEVEAEPEEGEDADEQGANFPPGSPARAPRPKKILRSPLAKMERRASLQGEPSRIQFIENDFLSVDWSDADFVFLNSTCYSPPLMQQISTQAESLKPGSIVVSLTKALTSPKFTILSKQKKQMSWGASTVFIQKRNE